MKKDIAKFFSKCLTCQQIKPEHQNPSGLLEPLSIPEWKWNHITTDFIVRLPMTLRGYDSIWVIIDRLTKLTHFLPVRTTYTAKIYAQIYIAKIRKLHGIPLTIISDRGTQFTNKF